MKITIDSAIPYIKGLFEPYAEVQYLEGRAFSAESVRNSDALIIRTRTKCNRELLEGSRVSHIATATIGYDHIDLEYCKSHGIEVTTAAGCNARGVLQWVAASLALLSAREVWQPKQKTLGVVGVGNVGRLIAEYASAWGFEVICCDPPRAEREQLASFVEFEELLSKADIVTFHTPLDSSTRHMLNSQTIKLLKPSASILNSSRGEVIESTALRENPQHTLLIDVWEHEPNIDPEILRHAIVSTPHIAGYSIQGKANGTAIVVGDISRHFNLPITQDWYPDVERNRGHEIAWAEMCSTIGEAFDIEAESAQLKEHPEQFEQMRNNYNLRCEKF